MGVVKTVYVGVFTCTDIDIILLSYIKYVQYSILHCIGAHDAQVEC